MIKNLDPVEGRGNRVLRGFLSFLSLRFSYFDIVEQSAASPSHICSLLAYQVISSIIEFGKKIIRRIFGSHIRIIDCHPDHLLRVDGSFGR